MERDTRLNLYQFKGITIIYIILKLYPEYFKFYLKVTLVYIEKKKINNNLKFLFQRFPYHMVETSPWPILTSFALLNLTVSAVMYFHGYENGGFLLSLGVVLTAYTMIMWFRDVILEGTKKKFF